ncbi:MAG: nitrous oxide reductase family maturation protein NosD [Gammaproteobacteria bacterium]|nr:nitrous oxide reductase family maturation protein NosD [Gammaproteobacteria bacterium]
MAVPVRWPTGRCRRLVAGAAALLFAGTAGGAELTVVPGGSIDAALRAARPGDVVVVERGDYLEHLVIDRPLTLRGQGRPTLSAGGRGDVIRIRAAGVTIEGLIIRDSGSDLTAQNAGIYVEPGAHRVVIRYNDLAHNLFGAWVEGVHDPVLEGNLITGLRELPSAQRGNGIQLYNTRRARVLDNHISFARDGIYVDVSHEAVFRGNRLHHLRYGTHYMNSNGNLWEHNRAWRNRGGLALMEVRNQVVRDNFAWGNRDHGIMLRTIQDSVIENNVVAGNGRGFFVYDAEYNTLRGNLVAGNDIGVHLSAGSYHNQVDRNDFIGNRQQIHYVAARDEPWGREGGNFWSNYAGWDRDGDGLGDLPYAANDLVDRLIWRQPTVKVLLGSPALQTLQAVARQFPVLRPTSIVDEKPRMRPWRADWAEWLGDGGD